MSKKIIFICDYRTLHAKRWIEYFILNRADIYILSTHNCIHNLPNDKFFVLSGDNRNVANTKLFAESSFVVKILCKIPLWKFFQRLYQDVDIFFKLPQMVRRGIKIVNVIKPDTIHAMRIQPEGWIARILAKNETLILTTWGQDFILYKNNYFYTKLNRWVLKKVNLLFVDTERDKYIADFLGVSPNSKINVLSSVTGGLKLDEFLMHYDFESRAHFKKRLVGTERAIILLNCRGFGRRYLENEKLLYAFKELTSKSYNLMLIIDGNKNTPGYYYLDKLIKKLKLEDNCKLVSYTHQQLQEAMTAYDFYVSLSNSDGTPVSMLEAMASGMIPITSNLRCFQDIIINKVNGFLVDISSVNTVVSDLIVPLDSINKLNEIANVNFKYLKAEMDWYKNMPKILKEYYLIN